MRGASVATEARTFSAFVFASRRTFAARSAFRWAACAWTRSGERTAFAFIAARRAVAFDAAGRAVGAVTSAFETAGSAFDAIACAFETARCAFAAIASTFKTTGSPFAAVPCAFKPTRRALALGASRSPLATTFKTSRRAAGAFTPRRSIRRRPARPTRIPLARKRPFRARRARAGARRFPARRPLAAARRLAGAFTPCPAKARRRR
ncbi:hypothetical protein J2794_004170 [Paraburkholderia terricola]|nr:hypothetical protein [Paraburkholderia terricola]